MRRHALVGSIVAALVLVFATTAQAGPLQPGTTGGLDCNGHSPIQQTVLAATACTDFHGFSNVWNQNTWNGRFYDNGYYIGHDEPDVGFISSRPGSGDDMTWTETLPRDPSALPTVKTPGHDVTHFFELSVAPWFSLDLCDPSSYPQLPCKPESDANAPDPCTISANPCPNGYEGGGSAFLEVQFYPPGDAPFVENISCDNTHWCASLHINEAMCTYGFASCNTNCEETTNFAFIQRDGIPTGPASPQEMNLASSTPNAETLLMNPGDHLIIHIFDAPAPGGGKALEVVVTDLTTHKTGFMQASAANGYARTSIADCTGTPFNYEAEYSTSKAGNIVPWAALQGNVTSSVEIGHFEPCTSVTDFAGDGPGGTGDPAYNTCNGPYESTGDTSGIDTSLGFSEDTPCYTFGDTHGTLHSDPNEVTACLSLIAGDLDFDGTSYWADWPTGLTPNRYPGSFTQTAPTSFGRDYEQLRFQTDTALSETTCDRTTGSGCAIPPPGAPGAFYPFWSFVRGEFGCALEFGNVTGGRGVNDLGGDAQYGTNQFATLGYPEFEGRILPNNCTGRRGWD